MNYDGLILVPTHLSHLPILSPFSSVPLPEVAWTMNDCTGARECHGTAFEADQRRRKFGDGSRRGCAVEDDDVGGITGYYSVVGQIHQLSRSSGYQIKASRDFRHAAHLR